MVCIAQGLYILTTKGWELIIERSIIVNLIIAIINCLDKKIAIINCDRNNYYPQFLLTFEAT